jgi:capsular exopolysaccharide synthesis family protein
MAFYPESSRSMKSLSVAARRQMMLASGERGISPRFLWAVFLQWWKLLVPLTLVLLGITVAAVIWLFPPQYRAAAWLQVKGQQPFVAFPDDGNVADRDSARKFVHTQIELLRSPLVIGRALGQPDVAQIEELQGRRDPIEWLAQKGLEVTPKGDSELLEVAFESKDPQSAKRLVDAVVNAYFAIRDEKSDAQIQSIIMLLENERTRRAEGIKLLQAEIRQLQAQLVSKDPSLAAGALRDGEVVISNNPLDGVQNNLGQAQIDSKVLEAQLTAIQGTLDQPPVIPDVLIDRQVNDRVEVQETIAQINQKRAKLDQIERAAAKGRDDPQYQRSMEEIEQLEATLESIRQASRPRIRAELEAMTQLERNQQLDALRTQLETQKLVVENLRANYDEMVKDLSQSGGQSLDLRLKQRELNRRQEVFDRISDRAAQLATEMYAPRRVEPIQDARVPEVPVESIPWKPLLLAMLASLALPYSGCVVWERSMRRITSAEQLEQEAAVPVIGEIARLPLRRNRRLDVSSGADFELGVFEESVDSLRTGLVLSQDAAPMQVLAVSSAVSGEGKSSVASQLAVSLARASGRTTLLIDGDMRSPDLHHIFQIDLGPGLAEVLSGGCKISECINQSWSEKVHILPAGELMKSPHKLLGGKRFETVINWARRHYRYVVIDTPPVLAASESMVMACAADGTLVCAMRDVSRESHIKLTLERLQAVGAKPIGTVLSGVPTRQYTRRYGSYVYPK